MNDFFQNIISKCFGEEIQLKSYTSVSGGCISNAYRLETGDKHLFLKWNTSEYAQMFESEAIGLSMLASNSQIHTPMVFGHGLEEEKTYLLLEWIEKGSTQRHFWSDFAANLAQMHRITRNNFGLDHNNFIGRLLQKNNEHDSWNDFFREERLKPQIQLAKSNGFIDSTIELKFEKLFQNLESLIPEELPSFLHGDLWSGNFKVNAFGNVSFFDPAIHYGHRETEIAFTKLFGGFSEEFYTSYEEIFPLEKGFEERIPIHNLYPLLVHVNLFGSTYLSGITQTLNRFT